MASEVKGIFTAEKLLLGRVGVETGKEGEGQDAKVVFILLSALCSHTITNMCDNQQIQSHPNLCLSCLWNLMEIEWRLNYGYLS